MKHDWEVIKHNEEHYTIKCKDCATKFSGTNHNALCSFRLRATGAVILAFLLGFALATWLELIAIATRV